MMKLTHTEYFSMLRQDFYAFIERSFNELNPSTRFLPNGHIEVIASELEACRRGEINREAITVPPRALKSHCTSVAFVAWLLGHEPSAQIICVSYAQELANKLASDCRALMSSPFYRRLFPTRLSARRQAVHEFATTKNGFRLATSIGGVLTGRGADYIIIDDPLKPDEAVSEVCRKRVNDWFDHTLYTRLNDKRNGCIILIMQRLHEDDLVGHVLEQGNWRLLRFPAIAEDNESFPIRTPYGDRVYTRSVGEPLHPEREPLETLQQLRQTLGEYSFAGQYQQNPAPEGGALVKREWFRSYTDRTLPTAFDQVFQSWDTANTPSELSAYSVCTTWAVWQKRIYLRDVFRKRLGYPELKRAVRELAEQWHASTVLIENKASGTQLIQELDYEGLYSIRGYEPSMDKIMRLHAVTGLIENGLVSLPTSAPWLEGYLHELTTFPKAKYDDQADSTSQALDWYKNTGMMLYGYLEYCEAAKLNVPLWYLRLMKERTTVCPNCGNTSLWLGYRNWKCFPCGSSGEDPPLPPLPEY